MGFACPQTTRVGQFDSQKKALWDFVYQYGASGLSFSQILIF